MACDVLCDQLLSSLFRDDDIGKEKDVVLEEIRSYEDEPAELVMDQLLKSFYGVHPLALPVLGNRKVIGALDRATLVGYRDNHYTADNVVIAAAGNVRHSELIELMKPLLQGLPVSGVRHPISPPDPRPRQRVTVRTQEQVHLALAAPAIPFDHPDRFVLQVLNNILGGGVSSRLFQEIREKRGLTYGISSGVEAFHDAGMLLIHTAVDPGKYRETADAINGILECMARGEISDAEIIRGRDQLKGNIFLALESTSNRMSRMASSKMYLGQVTPLATVMQMVAAVGPENVRAMAESLLRPDRFALAVLGPGTEGQYRFPWLAEKVPVQA
jgi:predicted Zn-dependent peptidase